VGRRTTIEQWVSGVAGNERAERKLLEKLAGKPFEKCEREWRALLRMLRLRLMYAVPVGQVLREGRWRETKNPLGYIKQVGKRRAIRMGLVERPRRRNREVLACELNYTDGEGNLLSHDEQLDQAEHECEVKHYVPPMRTRVLDRVHKSLLTKDLQVDWELVAELAGMDDAEDVVMGMRAKGFPRKIALMAVVDHWDRKILGAAWRRFDRDKKLLRKVLETGLPAGRKPSPRAPNMMFLLGEDGKLKIFFAKNVPQVAIPGT
jgi:hypothetical protein